MMRIAAGIAIFVLSVLGSAASATTSSRDDALCRPFFHDACSDALGRWLPGLPNTRERAAVTTVTDAIVDPYGSGPASFLDLRAVRGSLFVYGSAGPPKGHAVYDPKNRIALYDVGCCSWHEVVAHADVAKPPKRITERTLTGIHSMRGIRLGDTMEKIRATFGPSAARPVANAGFEQTITYRRPLAAPHESCDATMTFLFVRNRLTAMGYGNWC